MAAEEGDPDPDQQALVDMLITQAASQVDGQRQDTGDADTKALGVLGFALASVAFLTQVGPPLGLGWIPPGLLLLLGVLLMLQATMPRDFDAGPDVPAFYNAMAGESRLDSSMQMLSQLLRAVRENNAQGRAKSRAYTYGSVFLFAGLALAAFIAVIDSVD